jgi:hypothetical protein
VSQRCFEHPHTQRVKRAFWLFLLWPLHCWHLVDERAWVYPRVFIDHDFDSELELEHTGPVSIPDDSADDAVPTRHGRCRRYGANSCGLCMVAVQLWWLWLLGFATYKIGQLVSRTA